jgi:hypothetical protein
MTEISASIIMVSFVHFNNVETAPQAKKEPPYGPRKVGRALNSPSPRVSSASAGWRHDEAALPPTLVDRRSGVSFSSRIMQN